MRAGKLRPGWLIDAATLDLALYAAVAATPTPRLDRVMRDVSRAADHSRLWLGSAAALATLARRRSGRRAAIAGLASIATTSTIVNVAMKPLASRRRPDPLAHAVPLARYVPMPVSPSLPSGHAASAFAFATGVAHVLPREALVLRAMAGLVAYSRVHTGVHFPADVALGALVGSGIATLTTRAIDDAARRTR